jgi:hypothetical protein
MNSAFLVFDLVAGNAGLEVKGDSRNRIDQKLMTVKRRSGLSSEKRTNRVPAANASPNSTGRIRLILGPDLFGYQYVIGRIDFDLVRVRHKNENPDRHDRSVLGSGRSSEFKLKSA